MQNYCSNAFESVMLKDMFLVMLLKSGIWDFLQSQLGVGAALRQLSGYLELDRPQTQGSGADCL